MTRLVLVCLALGLSACAASPEAKLNASEIEGSYYWVKEEAGKRYVRIFAFTSYSYPEMAVESRYYPDASAAAYYYSYRSGAQYDLNGTSLTNRYCLKGLECRQTCSSPTTCEEWKVENFTVTGDVNDVIELSNGTTTYRLYNMQRYLLPNGVLNYDPSNNHLDMNETIMPKF